MAKRGLYGRLARFVLARRLPVTLAAILVVVLAAVVGLPPRVDPNLLALLPSDDPAAVALRELHDEEGGATLLTIAARSSDEEALEAFLDEAAAALGALPEVRFALHEVDEDLALRIGLLQLPADDVRELNARLRGALALGPALNPIVTQRLMDMGPVTERIQAASDAAPLLGGVHEGRGRILVRPAGSSHDQDFAAALMDQVDRILGEQIASYPAVELEWVGGAYRHSVEDRLGIEQDLVWTSVASLTLVLCLVAVCFRSLRAILIVILPLVAANVVSLSVASLLFGSLNTYTSFGSAILFGLGIDFAIHLVGRYRELRSRGVPKQEAIERAWDRTGPPCTTAAITSAVAFLALAAASFRGFSQLGILLATGLMLCLLAMLVLLPVMLSVLDSSTRPIFGVPVRDRKPSRSTYRWAPMGLMAALLVTGALGVTKLPQLSWEFDLSVLRRGGLAYDELDETEQSLARDSFAPVIVRYPSREALIEGHHRLSAMVAQGELVRVARVVSVESVLPADQADRLDALKELQRLVENPSMRYLPPPLVQRLQPLRGAPLELLNPADLPAPVLELVGAADADRHRLMLFPSGNMWDIREAAALTEELEAALPGERLAGEYIALGSLYRTLLRDMPLVAGLALLLVAAFTFVDFKRVGWTVCAIGTLLAGLVWAGAALESFGVKLSMINIVGLPFLFGIGVDTVLHLLHRLSEEGPGGVRRALTTTGIAVSFSTLTTVSSFASLALAGNRGVQSLGLLVAVGMTTLSVVSGILLSLTWAAGWRVTGQAPGDDRRR